MEEMESVETEREERRFDVVAYHFPVAQHLAATRWAGLGGILLGDVFE